MNQSTGQAIGSGVLSKEKTWDESTTDEKLEKIRREIRSIAIQYQNIARLSNDIEKLARHTHNINGDVVVKIERDYGNIGLAKYDNYQPLQ